MIKFWKFLSVPIVLAVCLGLLLAPAPVMVSANPGTDCWLEIDPALTTVGFNQSFDVDVMMENPTAQDLAVIMCHINFTASLVEVTGVDCGAAVGSPFTQPAAGPTWDNTEGWLDYDASTPAGTTTNVTSVVYATIHMMSKADSGVATIEFVPVDSYGDAETAIIDTLAEDHTDWALVVNGTVMIGTPTLWVDVVPVGKGNVTINDTITPTSYPNTTEWAWDQVVPLEAVEDVAGWTFHHWSGDVINVTDNPTNITIDLPKSVVAYFARYNLTVSSTSGGTVTQPGEETFRYPEGEIVSLVATSDTGYHFVNWTGEVGNVTDVDLASTTITMNDNYTIVANFAINEYTLTTNSTIGGNVTTPVEGESGPYDHGIVVNLTATPDANYTFVNWTGDVGTIDDENSSTTNITMTGNYTITANFALSQYNLTINSTIGGNVTTPAEGTFPYDHGTVVDLNATPDDNYVFVHWSGNVSEIADVNLSATNITMYGNYSIMAHFAPQNMSALPTPLIFTTDEGENPADKTLEICNTGNGTLNWSLSDNAGWLDESPTSGSLNETDCKDVTVSVDVTGLAAGDYSATITITGSDNIELEVPVSLHIAAAGGVIPGAPGGIAPPVLPAGLSASGLSISPQQVQPDQEVTISISVANSGGETGSYNAVLYINGAVEDSQSVSVAGGTSKNVIFTVSKSKAGVYDVSLAGQNGQFEVVGGGIFGGGLGTGGIVAIVVIVIALIVALVFILRGTRREV